MNLSAKILIGLISFLHLYILWFEMFAWETKGRKVFSKFPKELFAKTKAMAANQGLYNGFLAAGLIWTFFIEDIVWQQHIALFFLSCVVIAGIYGAYSVDKKIAVVQTIPAILAVVLIFI
jgi:putative membrane protein